MQREIFTRVSFSGLVLRFCSSSESMICWSGVRAAESADEEVEPGGFRVASSSLRISVKHADGDDCCDFGGLFIACDMNATSYNVGNGCFGWDVTVSGLGASTLLVLVEVPCDLKWWNGGRRIVACPPVTTEKRQMVNELVSINISDSQPGRSNRECHH